MHGSTRLTLIALLCALSGSAAMKAQDWPNWRGPHYTGATEAKGLPADFTKTKRVKWSTVLPGAGASTPIVLGNRIFLTSVDPKRSQLVALCVDRQSGEILWQRDAGSGYRARDAGTALSLDRRSTYASPSPVSDGQRVIFFFGNGDLVAFDLEGKETWRRNIQKDYGNFAFQWTFAATPALIEGKLFLPVLQRDTPVGDGQGRGGRRGGRRPATPPSEDPVETSPAPIESFLLAIDPATGKTLYKHVRPSPAQVESREAYATIIPNRRSDGAPEILCVGGDVLTGHDPATGKELWRWGTWNEGHRQRSWRLVPSAVVGNGLAVVCAPKRAPAYAVTLGGTGELTSKSLAWESKGRPNPVSSDVPTPAFHDGHFYVLSDVASALSKVEAATGEVAWTTQLSKDTLWRASPTVADGKVWCINHGGHVVLVDTATGKIVHEAAFGEEDDDLIRSTIVIAHGCVFIRTNTILFCLAAS